MNQPVMPLLNTGSRCNNNCIFCYLGDQQKGSESISVREIETALNKIRNEYDQITLTGGEITIRKDFISIVEVASRLEFHIIQIQSNGRMFAAHSFCKRAIKAGVNRFFISLYGENGQIHDFLTNSAESFAQTAKGIRNLKTLEQFVTVNVLLTRNNFRNLRNIAELVIYLKADVLRFSFPRLQGKALKNSDYLIPRYSMSMPYLEETLQYADRQVIKIVLSGFPHCILKNSRISTEKYRENEINEIIMKEWSIDQRLELREDSQKYTPTCENCLSRQHCIPPGEMYLEKFGLTELKTILK